MKTDFMAYKWVHRQTSTQKLYYLTVCTGLLNKKKIKMVRPTGTCSVFVAGERGGPIFWQTTRHIVREMAINTFSIS